VIYNFTPI